MKTYTINTAVTLSANIEVTLSGNPTEEEIFEAVERQVKSNLLENLEQNDFDVIIPTEFSTIRSIEDA